MFNIVPMKKSTVLFTLVAALFLCGCRSSKVKISGRFVGNEAKTVYLEQSRRWHNPSSIPRYWTRKATTDSC